MSELNCQAYRAAGQAVGALLVGAPVESVSVESGVRIDWLALRRPALQPDDRILARIFVVLLGVAAEQRRGFGVPPGDAVWLMSRTHGPELMRDVEDADLLSAELSTVTEKLALVWRDAAKLVCQDDVWLAIERVAEALLIGPLEGKEIIALCCAADEGSATD